MIRIRNISLAVAVAVVLSPLLGMLWLSGAVGSLALTDIGVPFAWADPELHRFLFKLARVGILYTLVVLPILLSLLFYRALASGDLWGDLRRRLWLFLVLFLIGFCFGQCLWLSGFLLA